MYWASCKNDQRAQLIGFEKIRDNSQCELCRPHTNTTSSSADSMLQVIIPPICLDTELNHTKYS